jgi:hypothetical protein
MDKVGKLTSILSSNFTELGKAIGQGENVLTAFGDTALKILADIGKAIGKQLIAQGSAMVASSIFGDVSKAGQGAALIAIGTGLIATSSKLASTIGGSGEGSGSGQDQNSNLEGGGDAGFDVGGEDGSNAPGRRRGGPVKAGSVYQTHGLGNREMFVPGVDGQIMTQDQLVGRGRSTQDQVRVVTENRLEGNIDGPDLFELDTRLKEVEKFKNNFARQ